MKTNHSLSFIAVAALLAFAPACFAQSTYSIPNPIMKPAGYGGLAKGAPQGGPVPMAGAPVPQVPALPPAISAASLPGQSTYGSAPSNDTVIRDTLATFTVTAIVGNRAVLRNNVGGVAAVSTAAPANAMGGANQTNATGPSAQAPLARQAVIRVKSDVAVYVAGVELTPTVLESRVEFRVAGRKAIVSTVTLESQSSYGYVPMQTAREVADPAVSARVSPVHTSRGVGAEAPPMGSAAPVSNGSANAPR